MDRPLHTARLQRKYCLSEPAQCFHLEFAVEDVAEFEFVPGQFVSVVAENPAGKLHSRAYSIASAPRGKEFDLCLDRVKGGYFSNWLCDLEVGQTVKFDGPHGFFLLRQPLTDSILVATGTGIAPMRGFTQELFPETGPHAGEDLSGGREIWLVYGTRYSTETYYREYFEKLAAELENFHYVATLSRADESWKGNRGYVQEYVERIAVEHAAKSKAASEPTVAEGSGFNIHAYICGLNEMVAANREVLKGIGWQRKQIVFERYD